MKTSRLLTACAIVAIAGSAVNAQSIDWLSPVDGNWGIAGNWTGSNIPDNSTEIAVLGHATPYTVLTTGNFSLGGINITNPDATLSIGSNQHTLQGALFNDGTIIVNTSASVFNGSLFFSADTSISGGGSIVLNGLAQTDDANLWVDAGNVVTHENGHTIRGSGRLQGTLNNNGLIVADQPTGVGLLLSGTLDQTGGGTVGADNGGTLLLTGGTTIGGEMFSMNGGVISVSGNNHILDGVTLTGDLVIPGNSRNLNIISDFTNNGTMELNPDLNVFNATLRFDNDATIGGSGTISMHSTGDFGDARLLTNGAVTMTIGADQTIEGSGMLDAATMGLIINRGTINANDPLQALGLQGAHLGDGGVYRADGGGELNLRNGAVVSNAVFDSSGAGRTELDISGSATISDSTNLGDIIVRGNGGTLKLEGGIDNQGVISLNPDGQVFNANVRTETGATIDGTGVVLMRQVGSSGDARLYAQTGATLTIGADQSVQGSGLINTDIDPASLVVNTGTINGNEAAIDPNPTRPLELGGNHEGMGLGVYRSDDGILQLGNGLVLNGGIFDSSGVGFVGLINNGTATIGDVTNLGDMRIFGQGGKVALAGNMTNNGTLTINSDNTVFNATLAFEAPGLTIDGSGMIRMLTAGNLNDAQLNAMDGVTGTIGFDQTVAGSGTIEGKGTMGVVTNLGLVLADDASAWLELRGTHNGIVMAGTGTYRATGDGLLSLGSGMYLNAGIFETEGNGQIAATGGTSTIAYVENRGLLGVLGQGVNLDVVGLLTNNGTVHINSNANVFNASLRVLDNATIIGTGDIVMTTAGNSDDARITASTGFVATLGAGQTLIGDGQLNGEFAVLGTIDPDGPTRLLTTDTVSLDAGAEMRFDLGGPTAPGFDRVVVRSGQVLNLNNATATISIDPGYVPVFGDTWDIIDGDTTGIFSEVVTDVAPLGQAYRVIYENDRVYAILTCDADLSGDGGIDFFDVSLFLSFFSNQDVRGDLNNDGQFNFFDVSLFLQVFGQGCAK